MVPLRIIRGDATSPQAKGPKIIAHVCNDLGGWGKLAEDFHGRLIKNCVGT